MAVEKNDLLETAIREGGFYGANGIWNSLIRFKDDNHVYRKRVETLIIRNGKELFLKIKPSGEYILPGGSSERDISDEEQAKNECREEARINVTNVIDTKITYKEIEEPRSWMKDLPIQWDGRFTKIFVADFESYDHEFVRKEDQDSLVASGQFYPFSKCFKILSKEHSKALRTYIDMKNIMSEGVIDINDEYFRESYFLNYFKNKKLLHEFSKNHEVDYNDIVKWVKRLEKLRREALETPEVKKLIKKRNEWNVSLYHLMEIKFPDGKTVILTMGFDKNEYTSAAASKDTNDHDVVVFYPRYFDIKNMDIKVYILLHELGHIRLGHTMKTNSPKDIFGNDITDSLRLKVQERGRVIYPEANADMYAILHGAKLYTIIGDVLPKDEDKKYDYRSSNAEKSRRYLEAYKKYKKYVKENVNIPIYEFTDHDFIDFKLRDFIFENENLSDLDNKSKNTLYKFLYEHLIIDSINDIDDYLITETSIVSDLDSNYKPKPKLNLSDFSIREMNSSYIETEKKNNFSLKHIDVNNENVSFFDGNKLVGFISAEEKDDGKWIKALEISKEYQKHGLGKQLLDYAVTKMNCDHLSVNKNNKVALKMYMDYGFTSYEKTSNMIFMEYNKKTVKEAYSDELFKNRAEYNILALSERSNLFREPLFKEALIESQEIFDNKLEKICEELSEASLINGENSIPHKYLMLLEKAKKRSNLPDSSFGIKELRKYPLDTKQHVLSAIRLYGHYADSKYAEELAHAILNAMEKYHISRDLIGEKNKIRKYMNN